MKIGKFDDMSQATSVPVLCKERKGPPGKGATIERSSVMLVDGHVRKEVDICAYGKRRGRKSGEDYCWDSKLYAAGGSSIQTASVRYHKDLMLNASFRDYYNEAMSFYNVQYCKDWEGSPLVYGRSLRPALLSPTETLGKTYHLGVKPELVHELGMAMLDLDFEPPELSEMLERIVKDKKPFEKNQRAYLALYEYLLGWRAKEYL